MHNGFSSRAGRSQAPAQSAARKAWCRFLLLLLATVPSAAQESRNNPGFVRTALPVATAGRTGFTLMAPEQSGLRFTNLLAADRSLTNHVLLNGSGVAAGDVDGDGRCDLYFCGLDGPNRLYRNLGEWKFEDNSVGAGVDCEGMDSTGAVLADLDGDGDLDLLVTSVGGGVTGFLNDGQGHFRNHTVAAGLTSVSASLTMALGDIDGDGTLDLYVANYRTSTMRDAFGMRLKVRMVNGRRVVTHVNGRPVTEPDLVGRISIDESGRIIESGEADLLYRNDGSGRFRAVSWTDGSFLDEEGNPLTRPPYDWGLTALFRDLNADGAPDLIVCNDLGSADHIWMNDGRGRFRAVRRLAFRHECWFTMGADVADVNRDGWDDVFTTDMVSPLHQRRHMQDNDHKSLLLPPGLIENRPQYVHNMLFLNQGDGDFEDIAYFAGVDASDWSWSPIFLDADLDGYEDILITTGFERDVQDLDIAHHLEMVRQQQRIPDDVALRQRQMFPRLTPGNVAFRNRGDLTFENVSHSWGFDFKGVSQGFALADLDNDGDMDVVINCLNGPALVLRNDSTAPRIAVRLRGQRPNTRGIGARIKLTPAIPATDAMNGKSATRATRPWPIQSQEMMCGGRYLSSDDSMRTFAAGDAGNRFFIEVTWRSGRHSVVTNALPNGLYEIEEPAAIPPEMPRPSEAQSDHLFADVSRLLSHSHHENAFDDFARQPLLPRRLSQLGPGATWCDLNGDGWEDLVIGAGSGGTLTAFRNDGTGGFQRTTEGIASEPTDRDETTILGMPGNAGPATLLIGSSNFEDGLTNVASVRIRHLGERAGEDHLPGTGASTGPLALADIDGSGRLALFVGGRTLPGRYPEAASSRLFRARDGRWEFDAENSRRFERLGLVSGAVFSDLDGDGLPELILACEWGPICIFRNDHGTFIPWDWKVTIPPSSTLNPQPSTLDQLTGWWNGVTTGDVEGDGRLDIIASNWGKNTKYEAHRDQPLRLYDGDFSGLGRIEIVEAYHDRQMNKIVPWQTWDRMAESVLPVRTRFQSFREYGAAGVAEILDEDFPKAALLEANWLESTVFLNRGDHFEVKPLPAEAQFSPAFAVCVADFDGDGHEDVFLSQNFFATDARTARYDAGRGLLLAGDGRGGFTAVPGRRSGIRVYGEQRGAAVGDYDADGRVDLVVTQNGAETRLYRNTGARPGLRIRIEGPPDNPAGIGATLRLLTAGRMGPCREIHAGSGYWSQDSAVQVMTSSPTANQLWIGWPGGRTNLVEIPAGAREIVVNRSGGVRKLH